MYRKDEKEDFYTKLAKKQGYAARSVYKLKEIDEKYGIIKKGDRVLDLGCSPGSWLAYISQKVGEKGRVVGIDSESIRTEEMPNISFLKKDVFDSDVFSLEGKFQTIVSDLAPKTWGIKSLDAGKSLELAERSFEIAKSALLPGGNFICKIFESEPGNQFFKVVEKHFNFAKRFRPKAVTGGSKEFYLVAKDFKFFTEIQHKVY